MNRSVFGEAAIDMPPLKAIQDSGVTWGIGSDGSRANQILPFVTLSWAVAGPMAGGAKMLTRTISREDALIAHTRRNAFFVFPGKQPRRYSTGQGGRSRVLDQGYLTIPAEQIKDIRVVMRMVGDESCTTVPRQLIPSDLRTTES
jgi:predicted amidohydrolase YtcJ